MSPTHTHVLYDNDLSFPSLTHTKANKTGKDLYLANIMLEKIQKTKNPFFPKCQGKMLQYLIFLKNKHQYSNIIFQAS